MSEVKVNKISPRSGTDVTLGDASDTFTVPTGAGLTVVDEVKTNKISPATGTAFTLGDTGDTFTVPSGVTLANLGTTTGFAGIAWQSVETGATFTAVAGKGYPVNTTAQACTVTFPASASAGDQIQLADYAGTFNTNNLTINPNGLKIQTKTDNRIVNTNRLALIFTYVDSTQGWFVSSGYLEEDNPFYVAPYDIDFLVVGGGGSSNADLAGGGGAGGYRTSAQSSVAGDTTITVTVGDGGTGGATMNARGTSGSDSSISGSGIITITSAGGGAGGAYNYTDASKRPGLAGGSGGGGAGHDNAAGGGGAGDTPATTPSQGSSGAGGTSGSPYNGGGGGGATAGGSGPNGGNGTASSITGASVTYAGGGAGVGYGLTGTGGSGGGGASSDSGAGVAGTANLGGGGGAGGTEFAQGGNGGKGVVILSFPDANYSGNTTGSPTVATDAGGTGKTVLTFTGDGTYIT